MSDDSRPAGLSAAAFSRGPRSPTKSPTKSPARAGVSTLLRHSVDDVSYRQADRITDQASAGNGAPNAADSPDVAVAHSAEKGQSKYIQLLSTLTPPSGSKARSPAAAAASGNYRPHAATLGGARQQQQLPGFSPPAGAEAPPPPPLRTSASPKGIAGGLGKSSSSGPCLRRSIRASILDTSQGSSMIPVSPESAAAAHGSTSGSTRLQQQTVLIAPGSTGSGRGLAAAQAATSPVSRLRSSTGSAVVPSSRQVLPAREPVSPVRRSAPSAAQPAKAGWAFGSRIEPPAAAKRRPSPTRAGPAGAGSAARSASPAQGDRVGRLRSAASPQRVPVGARASAPGASSTGGAALRSASAPRMSSAEKAQSRFTQHALCAAAAQRSRTPNPVQRLSASAVAAASSVNAGSGANAARRLRQTPPAADKHVARMRASDSALAGPQQSRLPGFSSTMGPRSPTKAAAAGNFGSPMLRAGSRSVLAASPAGGSAARAMGSAVGSRTITTAGVVNRGRPLARSTDRLGAGLSLPGAGSIAADAAAASQGSPMMIPLIKDRYKDLYKHTPASQAVEEAKAAAAAAAAPQAAAVHNRPASASAVPRLALGGLGGLVRQGSGEPLAAPRGPHQQHQHCQHQQEGGAEEGRSPFLGRISGMAACPAEGSSSSSLQDRQQQHPASSSFSTPQGAQRKPVVPLLALSTITPVSKSRPAGAATAAAEASPFTPLQAAGGYADVSTGIAPVSLSDIDLTPCPSAAPVQDETPSLLVKSQPRTGSTNGSIKGERLDQDQQGPSFSPQLAPRDLSSGMQDAAQGHGTCAAEHSRGFAVPCLQLHAAAPAAEGHFDSPPKHRRGERESPSSSADTGSTGTLKPRAHSTASSSNTASQHVGRPGAAGASKPRQRVGGAAAVSSVLETAAEPRRKGAGPPVQRSIVSGIPSPTNSTPTHGLGSRQHVETTPGSQFGKTTSLPSPSSTKKLPTPVPRLDLTPVLASLAAEQEAEGEGHSHHGMLLLEDAPRPRRLELDDEAEEGPGAQPHSGHRSSSGKQGSAKGHTGPGSGKGKAGSGRSAKAAVPGSKGSQASAEPPPQESFYVYESVMPPEEQKTYEELRRVLLKAGGKHAANLQGIWGCYQDARRNTEAMAFRGHRLLDQVSTEYSSFKREAEVKMQELQQDRDQAREELQLAMVAGSVPATSLQLAAKDREVRELHEQNSLLRQQVTEMERALQMGADLHAATQAAHQEQQVPVHARVIASSATTSILTNQVLQQQLELQQAEKRMEDMKAALHLTCQVLRQTNYMDQESGVRDQLDSDTVDVLDNLMIMSTEEAHVVEQHQQALLEEGVFQPPAVHIEEVHELDIGVDPADQMH